MEFYFNWSDEAGLKLVESLRWGFVLQRHVKSLLQDSMPEERLNFNTVVYLVLFSKEWNVLCSSPLLTSSREHKWSLFQMWENDTSSCCRDLFQVTILPPGHFLLSYIDVRKNGPKHFKYEWLFLTTCKKTYCTPKVYLASDTSGYTYRAIRKNLIRNLFRQRHSFASITHTSFSIFRPIAADLWVMDCLGIGRDIVSSPGEGEGERDWRRDSRGNMANEIYAIYLLKSDGIVAGCLFHHLFAVSESKRVWMVFQWVISDPLPALLPIWPPVLIWNWISVVRSEK